MSRPAEAAAKGIKGKLPDGVMQWEERIDAGTRRLPGKETEMISAEGTPPPAAINELVKGYDGLSCRETEFRPQRQLGQNPPVPLIGLCAGSAASSGQRRARIRHSFGSPGMMHRASPGGAPVELIHDDAEVANWGGLFLPFRVRQNGANRKS